MNNMATAGWLVVILGALSCASPHLGSGFWIGCSVSLWLLPVLCPADLQRPRGFGAWGFWALWGGVSTFLCRQPLISLQASWRGATEVLIFILAYSWWGRPHRRVFLAGLWATAALLGFYSLWTGRYDPVIAGFLAAALGSCLAAQAGELPVQGGWRFFLRALPALYAGLAAAAVRAAAAARPSFFPAWKEALEMLGRWPARGVGPGLYSWGALAAPDFSAGAAVSRSEWAIQAGEAGLIGTGLMLAAFFYAAPELGLLPSNKTPREWERQAAAGAFWGLAVLSLVEAVLSSPALGSLWFASLACAAPGSEELESRTLRLPKGVGVAAGIVSLLCALPAYYIDASLRPAPPAWARIESAVRLAPEDPRLRVAAARRFMAERPPQAGRALRELNRALEAAPRDAAAAELKAEILRRHG